MLEDQSEERACLYALGLLDEAASRGFEISAAKDEVLHRAAADFEETLANLALSTTRIQKPAPELLPSLLARIAAEPARVTTDREGRIATINPAFTQLCGYGLEDLRGRKPGDVLQGPGTEPAAVKALGAAVRAGQPCVVEMLNYHRDGSTYRARIAIEPKLGADGIVAGFAATARKLSAA